MLRGVFFQFQIDFDDADEEEADELQEEEEAHEEGETDVEINVTDKVESTEERTEEPSVQVASEENGNDVTPETDLEPIEADKKDEMKVWIFSSFEVKVKSVMVQNFSYRRSFS